jgi:hypothetical protein
MDEAGTTHKKNSLYNFSRNNGTSGNRASFINNNEPPYDLKTFDLKLSKAYNKHSDSAINQSSLSDIIATTAQN